MIKRALRAVAVAVAVAAAGLGTAQAQDDPIKIGAFLSVTGPASFLGDPELKTLELYIDKINENGGVLGRQLELVHYDTGGSAAKARTFAKRLISQDQVDLIIGGSTTGTTMAAVPLVERAGIPQISLAGAVVIIDPVKKWVFKTPQTDRMAAQKIFEDMRLEGITKVGLISGTGGFGSSGREQSLAVAEDYGIEIVADETYGPNDTDMTTQLTNIKNTPGVEAVLCFGFGQGPAIVTKNFAQLGMDLPLYQSHGVASDKFVELAGSAANGVRLPSSALFVAEKLSDNDPLKEPVMEYKREYEARYDQEVSTFGAYAYDALMIAVDAIERAGTTDKAKVRDAIEQTENYFGATGIFNMSEDDHMGLDLGAFRMLEIKNGEWTLVSGN